MWPREAMYIAKKALKDFKKIQKRKEQLMCQCSDSDPSKENECDSTCGMVVKDITSEMWREYEHGGKIFRIENPKELYYRLGGTTHRVVDTDGIVHCHPIPGNGCALRWKSKDPKRPISF